MIISSRGLFIVVLIYLAQASFVARAADVELRILGVHNGSQDSATIAQELQIIIDAWNATGLSAAAGVVPIIANDGQPIVVPGLLGSGDANALRTGVLPLLNSTINGINIRNVHGADVIIYFANVLPPPANVCGAVANNNFSNYPNSSFTGTGPANIDTSQKETAFFGVSDDRFPCTIGGGFPSAAHEFGHFFGVGHYISPIGFYADSLAYLTNSSYFDGTVVYIDVVSSIGSSGKELGDVCSYYENISEYVELRSCNYTIKYSDGSFGAVIGRNNAKALDKTALSVANYRIGGPGTYSQCSDGIDNDGDGTTDTVDGNCVDSEDDSEAPPPPPPAPGGCTPSGYPPVNLNARIVEICQPSSSATGYELAWDHACFGGVYEVFGNDNKGAGDYFVLTTPSREALISVETVSGDPIPSVKVRACSSGSCSAFSPPLLVADQC